MRTLAWMAVLAAASALTLSPAGCSREPTSSASAPRRNVLLIIVDTLRVDRLGCYGSTLGASPRIDRFAARSVRFEQAFSHAPWTLPSTASIMTSLYPPQHGAGGSLPRFHPLSPSVRTLAECLRDAGFATAEVVNVDFLTKKFGLTRGFEHVDFKTYDSNTQVRPAAQTTNAALAWLRSRDRRPFFLFVHYFDPHLVYAPPADYRARFADARDRDNADWVFGTRRQIVGYRRGTVHFDDATIRRAEMLYNGEVAYTDHELGRLLDGLDRLGLADSTIVVLTADHGEEFLDHGGFEHGHTLFNELVHVPLIIHDGRGGGRSVPTVVGHVDLAPTLCRLAGVKPDAGFVGRSLVSLLAGGTDENHPIVFEGNFWGKPLWGWLQGGYKLIRSNDGGMKLFDIAADPREQHDLAASEPERARHMLTDLSLALKQMRMHAPHTQSNVKLSPNELRRLEALGYAGGDDEANTEDEDAGKKGGDGG